MADTPFSSNVNQAVSDCETELQAAEDLRVTNSLVPDLVSSVLACGETLATLFGAAYSLDLDNSLDQTALEAMWAAFYSGVTDHGDLATAYENESMDSNGDVVSWEGEGACPLTAGC